MSQQAFCPPFEFVWICGSQVLFYYKARFCGALTSQETEQTASTSVLNNPLMVTLNFKVTSADPESPFEKQPLYQPLQ